MNNSHARYWNELADEYNRSIRITTSDFHYGPLIPGDSELKLLPEKLNGLRCLEFACGAGQNSIYLARQGAICTAADISGKQLDSGRKLAATEQVDIDWQLLSMEELVSALPGRFELIHSSYGLPFATDPQKLIAGLSEMLEPQGILLFSTPHPLFSGEWLELDGDPGLFLQNYFSPEPDIRTDASGHELCRSNAYPISKISTWLHDAGMIIERILEPLPCSNPPYASEIWEEYRGQFNYIPGAIIFKAVKLDQHATNAARTRLNDS